MDKISQWLSSGDQNYSTGLDLLALLSANNPKLKFLQSAQNAAKGSLYHNMLWGEIKNAYRIHQNNNTLDELFVTPKTVTVKPLALKRDKYVYNEIVDVKHLPPELQELFFRNQELTRELAGLHLELKAADTDKKRKTIAEKIGTLNLERISNWKQLDEFSEGIKSTSETLSTPPGNEQSELLAKIAAAQNEIKSGSLSKNQITHRKRMITQWKKKLQNQAKQ